MFLHSLQINHFLVFSCSWVYLHIGILVVRFHLMKVLYIFWMMMNYIVVKVILNFDTHYSVDLTNFLYVVRVDSSVFINVVVVYWFVVIYKCMKFHFLFTVFYCSGNLLRLIYLSGVVLHLTVFSFIVNYICVCRSICIVVFWNLVRFLLCSGSVEVGCTVCFFSCSSIFFDFTYVFFWFSSF